jgi:hypothetical protein
MTEKNGTDRTDPRVKVVEMRMDDWENDANSLGRKTRALSAALKVNIGVIAVVIGAFATAYTTISHAAEEKASAGMVKARQVEDDLAKYIERDTRETVELRNDIRALYKYLLTKQKQPSLEKLIDAGTDDGGR